MKVNILTLFPEMFTAVTESSILGKANDKGILDINLINIRDFSTDKHHKADDTPLGGGPGMVMTAQPIFDAMDSIEASKKKAIYMSPRGSVLDMAKIEELANMDEIVILCGHYEGVDCRFEDYVDEEMSIGDFVLTGGEIPAMAIADSVVRLLKGAIADDSTKEESFNSSLLEYPQYTYPKEYEGKKIPEILFCGNHQVVEEYHWKEALRETFKHRPDLLESLLYTKKDVQYLNEIKSGESTLSEKEKQAIEKGKRFTK